MVKRLRDLAVTSRNPVHIILCTSVSQNAIPPNFSCADNYENLGPDRRRGIGTDGFLGPIFDFGNG